MNRPGMEPTNSRSQRGRSTNLYISEKRHDDNSFESSALQTITMKCEVLFMSEKYNTTFFALSSNGQYLALARQLSLKHFRSKNGMVRYVSCNQLPLLG